MRAEAVVARRARQARRARRVHIVATTPAPALRSHPQLPCPPSADRQPISVKAA
jgi:hypothetical protein